MPLIEKYFCIAIFLLLEIQGTYESTYKGCFADCGGSRDLDAFDGNSFGDDGVGYGTMTPQVCSDLCAFTGYIYAGAQDGDQCFCGNSYGAFGTASCTNPCSGNSSEICGGSCINSVYMVSPPVTSPIMTLEACSADCEDGRDITGAYFYNVDCMTIELCGYICYVLDFLYAAPQNGDSCFCGNSYGSQGLLNDSDCSMPCVSNTNQTCGGACANQVYKLSAPLVTTGTTGTTGSTGTTGTIKTTGTTGTTKTTGTTDTTGSTGSTGTTEKSSSTGANTGSLSTTGSKSSTTLVKSSTTNAVGTTADETKTSNASSLRIYRSFSSSWFGFFHFLHLFVSSSIVCTIAGQ